MMIITLVFWILRLIDVLTTNYLLVRQDIDMEANPLALWGITNFGLRGFLAFNLLFSALLAIVIELTWKFRLAKPVILGFVALNLLVVVNNLFCLWLYLCFIK